LPVDRWGEQFVIRRKASALIKKAFDENGVKFALPRVISRAARTPPTPRQRRRSRILKPGPAAQQWRARLPPPACRLCWHCAIHHE